MSLAGRASYPEPDPTPTPSGAQPLLTPADERSTQLPDAVRWLRALASESGTGPRCSSAQGSVTSFTPCRDGPYFRGVFLCLISDISEGVFMTPFVLVFKFTRNPRKGHNSTLQQRSGARGATGPLALPLPLARAQPTNRAGESRRAPVSRCQQRPRA